MTRGRSFLAARVLLLVVSQVAWVGMARAGADTAPTSADLKIAAERFDQGRSAFKQSAFAEAAEHFEAADARAPSSNALGLAMRSRAEAGQMQRAATLAELVLRRHPDDAQLVEKAKSIIETAKGSSARVAIECSEDCELVVDSKLVHGRAASRWAIYLEPGKHVVAANWPNELVVTESVNVDSGESLALRLRMPEPRKSASADRDQPPSASGEESDNERPVEAESRPKGLSPTLFWVGIGATAVAAGATIWSGVDTLNNPGKDAVRTGCAGQYEDCELYKDGQSRQLRTNVLIGVTAVLAVSTFVTGAFFTEFSGHKPQQVGQKGFGMQPWFEMTRASSTGWEPRSFAGPSTVLGAKGRF